MLDVTRNGGIIAPSKHANRRRNMTQARKLMRTTTYVVVRKNGLALMTEHRSQQAAERQARAMKTRTDQKNVVVMEVAQFLKARAGEWTQ